MAYVVNRGTRTAPRWSAFYRDEHGRWRQKGTRQTSKAQAQRMADEWEARCARGEPAIPEPSDKEQAARTLTVLELLRRYAAENQSPRIKDRAAWQRETGYRVGNEVKPYPIAELLAARLRPLEVQRWRDALRQKYTPATVNRTLSLLAAAFSWAIDQEILPPLRNPARVRVVERLHVPEPEGAHYTLDEVHLLLGMDVWAPILPTALYTGLRHAELAALAWPEVHLDAEIPHIEVRRAVLYRPGEGYYLGPPKGRRPRTVPIHPELVPTLREQRESCPETPGAFVFPVYAGACRGKPAGWRMATHRDMFGIHDLIAQANAEAEQRNIKTRVHTPGDVWHACRHTLATLLTEACGDQHPASLLLGHAGAGPKVTGRYVHNPKTLRYLHEALCRMTFIPPRAGITPITAARRTG